MWQRLDGKWHYCTGMIEPSMQKLSWNLVAALLDTMAVSQFRVGVLVTLLTDLATIFVGELCVWLVVDSPRSLRPRLLRTVCPPPPLSPLPLLWFLEALTAWGLAAASLPLPAPPSGERKHRGQYSQLNCYVWMLKVERPPLPCCRPDGGQVALQGSAPPPVYPPLQVLWWQQMYARHYYMQ